MNRSTGMRGLLTAGLSKLRNQADTIPITGSRQATVLAVSAQKGGVGKTTTAVNLGCALAQDAEMRVLIIDIDKGTKAPADWTDNPQALIDDMIKNHLPPECQRAGFVWRWSSSMQPGECTAKAHVAFRLDRPLWAIEAWHWFAPYRVDNALFQPVQQHCAPECVGAEQ